MSTIIEEIRRAAGLENLDESKVTENAIKFVADKLEAHLKSKGIKVHSREKNVTRGGPDEMIEISHGIEADSRAAGYDPKAMENLVKDAMKPLARLKPHLETSRKTMDGHQWLYSMDKGKTVIGVEIAHDDEYMSFHVFEM